MSQPNRVVTEQDLARAASTLGVDVASVQAVRQVESKGSGFLDDGTPRILYERHEMYRQLKKAGLDADAFAAAFPAIVNTKPYGAGQYGKLSEQHGKLAKAATIDRNCALMSCSWGEFQIMGYHYKACGFPSIQEYVNAMYRSASAQLDAFVRFILADGNLLVSLRNKKWADFARVYNGPGYREFDYDTKLAAAYKNFSGRNA